VKKLQGEIIFACQKDLTPINADDTDLKDDKTRNKKGREAG
jgi:hypothetical protein